MAKPRGAKLQDAADVDMATLARPPTCVHDLAGHLRCEKCKRAAKRPPATLL